MADSDNQSEFSGDEFSDDVGEFGRLSTHLYHHELASLQHSNLSIS
jgi:hypothetical protein